MKSKTILTLALLSLLFTPALVRAQGVDSAAVARKLSSRIASERRAAAEELARLAAVEHRRLAEGYRVQEKDAGVKLALDWALYRMGKNETLFQLVNALAKKRRAEQV